MQESDSHKIYLTISRKIITEEEARLLGITLGCSPDDVRYYVTNCDVRKAAYEFLCFADNNYTCVEKWGKIIEALTALGKNTTIKELRLEEQLTAAKVNSLENPKKTPHCQQPMTDNLKFIFSRKHQN